MNYLDIKSCVECERYMSADDAHHKCQKCRNGGKWRSKPLRLTPDQRERYNVQRRLAYASLKK